MQDALALCVMQQKELLSNVWRSLAPVIDLTIYPSSSPTLEAKFLSTLIRRGPQAPFYWILDTGHSVS